MKFNKFTIIFFAAAFILPVACKKEKSSSTGWSYNDHRWGGFEKHEYAGQETGPGLVLVHGGQFTMGSSEHDLLYEHDNIERKVTVPSFYMDESEVTNLHYREYVYWLSRVYADYPEEAANALPDTLVWRDRLAYNEPYVEYYYRHPAYQDYPVVGVNWQQAADYAAWRTDRVNEMILIREGVLVPNPEQMNDANFNTDTYLVGQGGDLEQGKHQRKDYRYKKGQTRDVRMEDGILLPKYRLPTEAEWEFAAVANVGSTTYENVNEKKIYSWEGLTIRHSGGKEKDRGYIAANVKRGKGDQGGVAGRLNDKGFITVPVHSYWPNDHGLYNMVGNVAEWVMDVYRPLTPEDESDFNSFRGNYFTKKKLAEDGIVDDKDDLGRLTYIPVTEEENVGRRNYKRADNIGYLDEVDYMNGEQGYEYGVTTLIDNQARVYKGGSWNDRVYWSSPGTRRYLDEEQALSTLGFRCAMHRVGAP